MKCVYELQRGFSMGALTVLGLQLCLLTFGLGAKFFPAWSVSDIENQEDDSKELPPWFETGYGELHQAEAPELGLEMKYQDPQDYDIMLMKHRVRRSEKKKKKKFRAGALTPLGSFQQTPLDGKKTPAVARAKRQLKKGKQPRQRFGPGRKSLIGSMGPTLSSIQEQTDTANDDVD
ncbi:hypothetical protein MHYP_G00006640 [Metynnis hypsauchen]